MASEDTEKVSEDTEKVIASLLDELVAEVAEVAEVRDEADEEELQKELEKLVIERSSWRLPSPTRRSSRGRACVGRADWHSRAAGAVHGRRRVRGGG